MWRYGCSVVVPCLVGRQFHMVSGETRRVQHVQVQVPGHGQFQRQEGCCHPTMHEDAPHVHIGTVPIQFTYDMWIFISPKSCNCAYPQFHSHGRSPHQRSTLCGGNQGTPFLSNISLAKSVYSCCSFSSALQAVESWKLLGGGVRAEYWICSWELAAQIYSHELCLMASDVTHVFIRGLWLLRRCFT